MDKTIGTKVPFNSENVGKCLCPECPVQAKNKCVQGKLLTIKESLGKTPLVPEEIPGLYCSSGVSSCTDLDFEQGCICGNCRIFDECKLSQGSPVGYYCRDGCAK